MKLTRISIGVLVLITEMFFLGGCKTDNYDNILVLGREPVIEPDYSGVTIPPNIAPMNFIILEDGRSFKIRAKSSNGTRLFAKSSNGIVRFPVKAWKRLLGGSQGGKIEIEIISKDKGKIVKKYDPIFLNVANEPIDPYLCYRLLYPGYKFWGEMKIVQRSTEDFKETSLFENQLLKDNCVNCHSFKQNNPGRFLLHVRGSLGGTYFVNGEKVTRTTLKTQNMPANAVYPSWHPSGRYVAFSSNRTVQSFHMRPEKNIEVSDRFSSLIIYDVEKNEMFACADNDTVKYMETFPCWSPDGNYLYYCRTHQVREGYDYREVRYDLVRKPFNQASGIIGKAEVVFDALVIDKSVSFPSISPDGQYLVFTLHDYGTFSIWHKEADLYILNLQNRKVDKMSLNSSETESYHSWSSNGKWLVFSSKRGDGLTARPYFAYFGSPDNVGKPFILPQKNPTLYKRLAKTFNRPEFVTGRIKIEPRDFARASRKESLKAKWVEKR
jgi:WD40 repeat protein